MGVTIYYKGKLDSVKDIASFCDELEDIAKSMQWKHSVFREFDNKDKVPLKGLIISPHPDSESLQFMTDQLGFLRNAFSFRFREPDDSLTFSNFIKTQFAPVDIHIAIVKLLKYVQKKYISNLEVYDDGQYWETGDAGILEKKINFLNSAMDFLEDALNSTEFKPNDTVETVAQKIEEILKRLNLKKP